MKNFLAVYTGSPEAMENSSWNALSAPERQERERVGVAAWQAWMQAHAERIIVAGGPLGKTLRVSPTGVQPVRNNMTGYVVVAAESHEDAARLFENHPHFAIFPGEGVEVMACLPMPGM